MGRVAQQRLQHYFYKNTWIKIKTASILAVEVEKYLSYTELDPGGWTPHAGDPPSVLTGTSLRRVEGVRRTPCGRVVLVQASTCSHITWFTYNVQLERAQNCIVTNEINFVICAGITKECLDWILNVSNHDPLRVRLGLWRHWNSITVLYFFYVFGNVSKGFKTPSHGDQELQYRPCPFRMDPFCRRIQWITFRMETMARNG